MKKKISIIDAIQDPNLLGGMDLSTRQAHIAFLKSVYALPMDQDELSIYRECTGRTDPPEEPAREIYLIAGRRSGKSELCSKIMLYEALFGSYTQSKGEILHGIIISPTKKQSRIIKGYIRADLENPMLQSQMMKEGYGTFILKGNRAIMVLASDYRSIRGFSAYMVALDEGAFMQIEGARPIEEILVACRPMLVQSNGKLVVTTTPYSRSGPVYEAYRDHYGEDGPVLVWKAPSLLMNPTLDKDRIEEEAKKDPASAASEYYAEWREGLSTFLDPTAVDSCIFPYRQKDYNPSIKYIAFSDPSGGRSDSFCTAVAHIEKGRITIDGIKVTHAPFNPISTIIEHSDFLRHYKVSTVMLDSYAAEFSFQAWRDNDIEPEACPKRASDLYLSLEIQINTQNIEMPDLPLLRKQLVNLERRTSRSGGKDQITHPLRSHDDLANACAGCAWLLSREKPSAVRQTIEDRRSGKVLYYKYVIPGALYIYWRLRRTGCGDYAALLKDGNDNPERIFDTLENFEKFLEMEYCIDVRPPSCEILHNYLMY